RSEQAQRGAGLVENILGGNGEGALFLILIPSILLARNESGGPGLDGDGPRGARLDVEAGGLALLVVHAVGGIEQALGGLAVEGIGQAVLPLEIRPGAEPIFVGERRDAPVRSRRDRELDGPAGLGVPPERRLKAAQGW